VVTLWVCEYFQATYFNLVASYMAAAAGKDMASASACQVFGGGRGEKRSFKCCARTATMWNLCRVDSRNPRLISLYFGFLPTFRLCRTSQQRGQLLFPETMATRAFQASGYHTCMLVYDSIGPRLCFHRCKAYLPLDLNWWILLLLVGR
jgi:hypothetical protein